MVGKISSISPARCRARATAGRTHWASVVSPASWVGTWPGGAAATKNRVS